MRYRYTVFSAVIVFLVTSLFFTQSYCEDMSAYDIVKKSEDLLDQAKDSRADMLMVLVDKKGNQRKRTLQSFVKSGDNDESKSIIFFITPADVKGTSFLVWSEPDKEDDQWLYLPALRRVRQISSSGKGESFMGTEFTYFDMGGYDIDDNTYTLVKEEPIDNNQCYVIEALPKVAKYYSKRIIWIRKDIFVPVKIDFYDKKGLYLKQGIFSDIKDIQGINTPTRMEMYNKQNKRSTVIELSNVVYDTGLKDDIFTQRYMKRGR